MGAIAKSLGLTDTAGAFAAGVLLANTNYRAQIQADVLPFKGILLGIFFMGTGSSFDTDLVLREWPTIIAGAVALVLLKAVTLASATRIPRWLEPNRLAAPDGVRLAILLSGGGEFAFVVLALAEKLQVIPSDLGGLLTAIVLITMGVTPLLGTLAEAASAPFLEKPKDKLGEDVTVQTNIAEDSIVVCGYCEVGRSLLQVLGDNAHKVLKDSVEGFPEIVAIDNNPSLTDKILHPTPETVVYGANPSVIRSCGVQDPVAIFVAYEKSERVFAATSRLRGAFPDTPIYTRAQTRAEAQALESIGATEVVVEADELPRSAVALLQTTEALTTREISAREEDVLMELFQCLDQDGSERVSPEEIANMLRKSNAGLRTDDEVEALEAWVRSKFSEPLDFQQFCQVYIRAPEFVQNAMGDSCML